VVHDVLHHLPDRRCAGIAAQQLVFNHARHALIGQAIDERAHLLLVLDPRAPQRGEIGEAIRRQERRRRLALPAHVPRPLRRVDVRQRVADRLEAAAEILVVLFGRQRLDRLEQPVARPVVIVDERQYILPVHGITLTRRIRSSRGYSRSRYALPPSKSGCCFPARIPPPDDSPYSLLSASATSMPATTRPNGTNPCASCGSDRSFSAPYICVVRPSGTANANV